MNAEKKTATNVKQAVPFFHVSNMEESLGYYVEGLGFEMTRKWIDEGKLRWCWLEIGDAALMLQEFRKEGHDSSNPSGKVGEGVSVCFQCEDALAIYRDAASSSETVCGWCLSRTPMATESISRAQRTSPRTRSIHRSSTDSQPCFVLSLRCHGSASANDAFREALHFLELWTELEQDEVHANSLKSRQPL